VSLYDNCYNFINYIYASIVFFYNNKLTSFLLEESEGKQFIEGTYLSG